MSLRQTLYKVQAAIAPPAGLELCRTGSLCALEVCITRLADLLEVDRDEALTEAGTHFTTRLMYEGESEGWTLRAQAHGTGRMRAVWLGQARPSPALLLGVAWGSLTPANLKATVAPPC